jgi:CheY-like chemotaxis protein
MLQAQQMRVTHVPSVEEALAWLQARADGGDAPGADLVLTDVYLKGELSGHDLLDAIRNRFGYGKRRLPVLVMTGDFNRVNQMALLREGANDLVIKPIEERLLVTKALFQLRVARLPEQRAFDA